MTSKPITDEERLEVAQGVIEYDSDTFDSDTLTDRENNLLDALILERRKTQLLGTAATAQYDLHKFTLECANDGVVPECLCPVCCAVRSLKS